MKKITLLLLTCASSVLVFGQAPKRVVVEDFTGTWCGYCPRGKTTIDDCVTTFPNTIGMEVHNGDSYANTYSDAVITAIAPAGFPMGSVDRFAFGGTSSAFDTGTWKAKVGTRSTTTSPVSVDISSTYNASTKAVSVTVTAKFVAAASGDMRISCLLTEDNVVTSTDGQHNYYCSGCGAPDPNSPWYTSPATITTYVHNGVARTNLAPNMGTTGVIPASVTAGGTYSQTYTYTLPANWPTTKAGKTGTVPNPANIYIVAFVGKGGSTKTSYEILNANKVKLGSNTTTGVIENPNVDPIQVKQNTPNPFSDVTALQFTMNTTDNVTVKVYNAFGQVVKNLFNSKLVPGEFTFYWTGDDDNGNIVPGGVYYYTISTTNGQVTKPMVFIGQQ